MLCMGYPVIDNILAHSDALISRREDSVDMLLTYLLQPEYAGDLGQHHGCWCPGSLRRRLSP